MKPEKRKPLKRPFRRSFNYYKDKINKKFNDFQLRLNNYLKKPKSALKKSFKRLKYLDKSKARFFMASMLISFFCLFVGGTHAYFQLSEHFDTAIISIANLKYTLTSTNSNYQNSSIEIEANQTLELDLDLKSLNKESTKYALNYSSDNSSVKVQYQEKREQNVIGTIGGLNSIINMKVVIVNDSSTKSKVTFNLKGGYLQNILESNITEEASYKYSLSSTNPDYKDGYIDVPGNKTVDLNLKLRSLNNSSSYYALDYSGNADVYYKESYEQNVRGDITAYGTKTIRVLIENPSSITQRVRFSVTGSSKSVASNITTEKNIEEIPVDTTNFTYLAEDFLPYGGFSQNSRTHNLFGVDIEDFKGMPQNKEVELFKKINEFRKSESAEQLKITQPAYIGAYARALEGPYLTDEKMDNNKRIDDEQALRYLSTADFYGVYEEWRISDDDMTNYVEFFHKCEGINLTIEQIMESITTKELASLDYGNNKILNRSIKYGAVGIYEDTTNNATYIVFEGYSKKSEEPNPSTPWSPGKGIDYSVLGFTLDDIPIEYPDWLLNDPDMDLESYGPTDHDINSLDHWLIDHGVEENSELLLQIKAHYYSILTMNEYLKYMFSLTDVFHYTYLMPGEWSDINTLDPTDITIMKEILVKAVADKLAYQHLAEEDSTGTCNVCGEKHAEKRDLDAATTIVNQFFTDTYSFDISSY